MGRDDQDEQNEEGLLYRLEVRGHLLPGRRDWFDAESMAPAGPNTVIRLRVADQSDLYGKLRRIHDLNLRLISVRQVEGGPADGSR